MKSLSITGLILLAVSALLFYLTTDFAVEQIKISHIMGMMAGVGVGLIIGGMVGYVSKGSAIKAEQKKKNSSSCRRKKKIWKNRRLILQNARLSLKVKIKTLRFRSKGFQVIIFKYSLEFISHTYHK